MSKMIDLTGQDFGYWHVIERAENTKGGRTRWTCKCMAEKEDGTICGNIKIVDGAHLRSGRSTKCTDHRIEAMRQACIKNEQGKTYGFLYVEREATKEERPRDDRTGVYWNCTCTNCGRHNVIIFGDYLRKGETKSCGCISSYHETAIKKMFDTIGITYKTQYSFKDLLSPKSDKHHLYFDFAVFNGDTLLYLLEYDGSQHFHTQNSQETWNNEEALMITHERDVIKNQYCFKHNIPIIRIPYDIKYDINDLKLETTRFLLTPENEQEYYESRK